MATKAKPDVERLLSEGAAHYAAGRLQPAARAYIAAERASPKDFRPIYSLAMIDITGGRFANAAVRLRRTLKLNPTLFPALFNLGRVSERLGRWDEAALAWAGALAERPEAQDARFALAVALCTVGRIDEGVAEYRTLASDPRLGAQALARLALIRPETVTDAELAALRQGAANPAVEGETRIGLTFALGEVLEARQAHDDAFAAFAAGNRAKFAALAAAGPASDPRRVASDHARAVAHVQALFTPTFLADHRGGGDAGAAPIFIVGMPRSGSTLIEQILASHPSVEGMGEGAILGDLLGRARAYDPATARDKAFFRGLAEAYLATMRERGWARRLRLVDKTLENHVHVGMIALMFPRAVIIESVRDPIDTCLACYRQLFTRGNEPLYDLAQIGEAYRVYRAMMDHWAQVLPGRVIPVSNEALVADPEGQIHRLVTETCGLPWNAACLRFYETARGVTTASTAQVRRPMFSSSIGRWRRYERHLAPLLEALGPYASTGTHHSTQAPARSGPKSPG